MHAGGNELALSAAPIPRSLTIADVEFGLRGTMLDASNGERPGLFSSDHCCSDLHGAGAGKLSESMGGQKKERRRKSVIQVEQGVALLTMQKLEGKREGTHHGALHTDREIWHCIGKLSSS